MQTDCSLNQFRFQGFNGKSVVASFDGGRITSDAGGLLLREIEQGQQFLKRFSQTFLDLRNPKFVEHSVYQLVSQRIYGLCFGYEDLNDHDQLRTDPLLAQLCGKKDLEGNTRRYARDREKALAGKSTFNRLETAGSLLSKRPRYKKILADTTELEEFFVNSFLRTTKKTPRQIILDFDATDDLSHEYEAQVLYERLYCARGEMENRIKEQQLYLFADRTSSATMAANQLRLWFSSLAYVILNEFRAVGLRGTRMAQATCASIRLKLLKIGANVNLSVRRVAFTMASGYPDQQLFASVHTNPQSAYHSRH